MSKETDKVENIWKEIMSKLFLYNKQNKPRIFKNRILKNMNHVKIMFLVNVFKERKITKHRYKHDYEYVYGK